MKVFLTSQQKAGTYLAANLLEQFNLKNPHLHFEAVKNSKWRYQKYDIENIEDARRNPANYTHYLDNPLRNLRSIVPGDGFAVGHIPYSVDNRQILDPFKRIVMMRPIEECKESMRRWRELSGKLTLLNEKLWWDVGDWKHDRETFQLWFSDITDGRVGRIDALQKHLFGRVICNSEHAINAALEKDSITKNR